MNDGVMMTKKISTAWVLALLGLLTGLARAQEDSPSFFADNQIVVELVQRALERNPAVQEGWSRYRASLQRVPQVSALPDPMLTFTHFVRSVETRVGPQLNVVAISQSFPWFGKLDLAGQAALEEAASQYHVFQALRKDLVAELKSVYYDLCYIDKALSVADEEKFLLEHYERLSESRYASGQGLQQAVIKLQAELAMVDNRTLGLRQQRAVLAARLNTLLGTSPDSPPPPVEWAALPPWPDLKRAQLFAIAEENRDELKAALSRIDKQRQGIELARRDYWPNFTVGAGFVNVGDRNDPAGRISPPPDNGKNAFSFSLGITLPIWRQKYNARALEAVENLVAERQAYRKILDQIEFVIQRQALRLETLREQIELFSEVLEPQNEEALRSAESAYSTGQTGVLDLLDSERSLLQIRLSALRLQADYRIALSDLERALGTRFPR